MNRRLAFLLMAAMAALLTNVACGSSPTSSSAAVVVRGTVLEATSGTVTALSAGAMASSSKGRVTVTVAEDPSLTVTVSGNGTFVLEGLPTGTFTLVFTRDGVTLGTVTVTGVGDGAEVKIVVQVNGSTVVLVELKIDDQEADTDQAAKTCLINGGRAGDKIELEGRVDSGSVSSFMMTVNGNRASGLVTVNTSGASSYKCVGQAGKGSTCPPDPLLGSQVHVSGTLTSCDLNTAVVTASEVKVQK